MRVSLSVTSSGGDLVDDAAALRSLPSGILTEFAQIAADYGTPAVLLAASSRRGSLSMSNNKQASRLDALPIVRPGETHAEAEIVAVPRGAWHLSEYGGSPPGVVTPKRKYGNRGRAAALSTPHGPRALTRNHPGAGARPVWGDAMADAEPVIDDAIVEAFSARGNELMAGDGP